MKRQDIKSYETIVYPIVSSLAHLYGCRHYVNSKFTEGESVLCAFFHFPSASAMCLDWIGKMADIHSQKITKIYGIK